ncbi:MAG: cobalt-precorrin-6A reductase [Methyloligellaceae bacterium]
MRENGERILILGGTAEAREVAALLAAHPRFEPLTSLAGVTGAPAPVAGAWRRGGFGGAAGMARFIADAAIAAILDVSHPFAARISANAAEAARQCGIPCLRLERPAWQRREGDDWTCVGDVESAVRAIPQGARAFVTLGRQGFAAFLARDDTFLLARMIEPPHEPIPAHAEVILARPPFTCDAEMALMQAREISVLVTRNAGGAATYAKVEAARRLSLPVIMIDRPVKPDVPTAADAAGLVAALERSLA